MNVYVVFYDQFSYTDLFSYNEHENDPRFVHGVFDSAEKAREEVHKLSKFAHVSYADFEVFEVQ